MVTIDVYSLREDLKNECYGAFFGGGFGAALMETFDIDYASPEELVKMAQRQGVNLNKYIVDEGDEGLTTDT